MTWDHILLAVYPQGSLNVTGAQQISANDVNEQMNGCVYPDIMAHERFSWRMCILLLLAEILIEGIVITSVFSNLPSFIFGLVAV